MNDIKQILAQQISQRLISEGVDRILICLQYLDQNEVWFAPNKNTNSVGNLILHLDGNVRQWLLQHVGLIPFTRDRDSEFDTSRLGSKEDLILLLHNLKQEISNIKLDHVVLEQSIHVQGFQETYLGVIIHVIEHFSYHTGQITLLTKIIKDIDTGYYEHNDLTSQ